MVWFGDAAWKAQRDELLRQIARHAEEMNAILEPMPLIPPKEGDGEQPLHSLSELERDWVELQRSDAARRTLIAWAGSGGFAAAHNTGGTVETITDDLMLFLWQAGFKVAPLDDGDWF